MPIIAFEKAVAIADDDSAVEIEFVIEAIQPTKEKMVWVSGSISRSITNDIGIEGREPIASSSLLIKSTLRINNI